MGFLEDIWFGLSNYFYVFTPIKGYDFVIFTNFIKKPLNFN